MLHLRIGDSHPRRGRALHPILGMQWVWHQTTHFRPLVVAFVAGLLNKFTLVRWTQADCTQGAFASEPDCGCTRFDQLIGNAV